MVMPSLRQNHRTKDGCRSGRVLTAFVTVATLLGLFSMATYLKPPTESHSSVLLKMPANGGKSSDEEMTNGSSEVESEGDAISSEGKVLVMTLEGQGTLRIKLRPDWSPESVDVIEQTIATGCKRCKFYRAEKPGIFQGIMKANKDIPLPALGPCPPDMKDVANKCFSHDPNCACHGPLMNRGMVGWAGGGAGPDFFIDHYENTAKHWGTTHTAWGELEGEASHDLVKRIWGLPSTKKGGMTFLDEEIRFTMSIESSSGVA